jgi:hypothetical protein
LTIGERLCSLYASRQDEDPIGKGAPVARLLALEVPMPWPEAIYQTPEDGVFNACDPSIAPTTMLVMRPVLQTRWKASRRFMASPPTLSGRGRT